MDIYQLVGKRIREERVKAKMTLEDLAEASSLSASFLAYIERGKKKASLQTIQKLADGLQIPLARFFAEVAPRGPGKNEKAIRKLVPLLREKKPNDQDLIIDVLKTLSKGLPKR